MSRQTISLVEEFTIPGIGRLVHLSTALVTAQRLAALAREPDLRVVSGEARRALQEARRASQQIIEALEEAIAASTRPQPDPQPDNEVVPTFAQAVRRLMRTLMDAGMVAPNRWDLGDE